MQIMKPDNLGLLYSPCMLGESINISIALLACFPLSGDSGNELLEEAELWKIVAKQLGEDEALDMGHPKQRGEFLVYGSCHAETPSTGMQVEVSVAGISKVLQVTGRQHWNHAGTPDHPEPFKEIRIAWSNAFGGEGYDRNPVGIGFNPDSSGMQPLPLVQDPRHIVSSPADHPEPAGFTAINQFWPQRARYLGRFDDAWLHKRWPHYPHDTDPEYFNTAPQDQRLSGYFRGDEQIRVHNMHPEKPVIDGHLPGLRARLFLNHLVDLKERLIEVETRPETLWLFPDGGCGVLLYRGAATVADETLDDVLHLMAAWEPMASEPLPFDHYRESFYDAVNKAKEPPPADPPPPEPPVAPEAAAPAPAAPPPPADEPAPEPKLSPEVEKQMADLKKKLAGIEAQADAAFAKLGLTREQALEKYLPAPKGAGVDSLADLEKLTSEIQGQIAQNLKKNGLPPIEELMKQQAAKGAVDPQLEIKKAIEALKGMEGQLKQSGVNLKEAAAKYMPHVDPSELDFGAAIAGLEQLAASIAATSAAKPPAEDKAPPEEPVPEPEPEKAPDSDEDIIRRLQSGETLSLMDLSGRDFKGAMLHGAKFSHCILEGTNFSGCQLEEAVFDASVLSGADLSRATLSRARFSGVTALKADFTSAVMVNAAFSGSIFGESVFDMANLAGAALAGGQFPDSSFKGASLCGARAEKATFTGSDFSGANLEKAVISSSDFSNTSMDKASFREVQGTGAAFYGASLLGTDFTGAHLDYSRVEKGTHIGLCSFSGASIRWACWEGATLKDIRMDNALLDHSDFSRCQMERVFLFNASLKESNFMKAVMESCDLRGGNCFKASFRHAVLHKCDLKDSLFFGADLYGASIKESDTKGTDFTRIQSAAVH